MFGLGIGELSIILVIVIVVFGATRLPMIGSGLGKGIKNFRSEVKTKEKSKIDSETEEPADEEITKKS
jgi:sec-independent protein translocase protein TatA